ncbi:hypothetical protein HAX54_040576 [Datura stramonium]|uniref:Uncharacterized protein n=1 Tax=Datura stramonium TaxID=4076 RepID=A0ABS8VRU2_DATST|nr:hypothetical protein [Datura stramonium]
MNRTIKTTDDSGSYHMDFQAFNGANFDFAAYLSKLKKVPNRRWNEISGFKKYILRAPTHDFPENNLLDKFYTGLDSLAQSVANTAANSYFMDKTFARITIILNKITKYNQARHAGDNGVGVPIGAPSINHMIKENQERDK